MAESSLHMCAKISSIFRPGWWDPSRAKRLVTHTLCVQIGTRLFRATSCREKFKPWLNGYGFLYLYDQFPGFIRYSRKPLYRIKHTCFASHKVEFNKPCICESLRHVIIMHTCDDIRLLGFYATSFNLVHGNDKTLYAVVISCAWLGWHVDMASSPCFCSLSVHLKGDPANLIPWPGQVKVHQG